MPAILYREITSIFAITKHHKRTSQNEKTEIVLVYLIMKMRMKKILVLVSRC